MNRPYLSTELRRAETVATVVDLAASNDPGTLTTGQIASTMGVSQGALFRHFPDKTSIWIAVLEWTCAELNRRFDALAADGPLARLEAMLAAHVDFVVARPGVPRILFGELQRVGNTPTKAIARDLMAEYRAKVARELSAARDAGEIAASTDTDAAAVMFLAMVQGMVMQGLAVDNFRAMPTLAPSLFRLFRRALGATS